VWGYGVCAVRRFASKVQLEQRLKTEPRTSKLIQKIRRLKLLSAVFYWFFSIWFFRYVCYVVVGWVVVLMLEVCL